jgi:hypothetical protein
MILNFKFFINYVLSFCIVFSATLHSIYFYQISLAPFPVISFLLLLFNFKSFGKTQVFFIFSFYIIFISNAFFGFLYSRNFFYLNSLLGIAMGPVYLFLFYNFFKSKFIFLEKAISITLIVHVVFFYIQFVSFYLFGFHINFLQMITGEESRVEGFGVLTGLIRSSGLCNEPASYSLFVSLLSFFLISIKKRLNVLIVFALLSCMFSLSISGILFAFLIIFYFVFFVSKGYKNLFLAFVFSCFFIFLLGYLYFDLLKLFVESRFVNSAEDGSFNTRFNDGFKYFFEQDIFVQVTGLGIGNFPPNDISTVASGYMAIFIHLGYFFTFLFLILNIYIFKFFNFNLVLVIFFIIFLSSTMTILNIHYWMSFSIILLISNIDKKNRIVSNLQIKSL